MQVESLVLRPQFGARLERVWRLVELVLELRTIRDPLTTETGLRQAVGVLLRLAEMVGLDAELVDRLRQIVEDDHVLGIVLAVLRYVARSTGLEGARGEVSAEEVRVDAAGLVEWLPWAWQIARLVWLLRGEMRDDG